MLGFGGSGIIDQIWYISAMLLCMALIYPQIRKLKDNYFCFWGILQAIIVGGLYFHLFHNLDYPETWVGFTYRGVIRAFFEINIGACLYPLVQKIKDLDFTKFGVICITFIEILGFAIPVLAAHFIDKFYGYILLLMLISSVTLAFSEKTLDFKYLNNKFVYFLEKISIPIYFIHIPVRDYIKTFNLSYYVNIPLILVCSIIAGIIMYLVVDYLRKRDFYIPQIKKIFIKVS